MNRVQSIVRMRLRDRWTSFYIPWLILLSSFAVNLFISYLINNQEPFYTGGLMSIFISIAILGAIHFAQTFPFALGMSVRRKDFFLGTAMAAVITNAVSAVVLCLFSLVESATTGWGVNMHFFNLAWIENFSVLGRFGIYMAVLLHLHFFGITVSSIFRRYGRAGLYVFFTALLVIFSGMSLLITHYQWWIGIGLWCKAHMIQIAWYSVLAVVLYGTVSYVLLRRATVQS
ncbi:hypothetical protein [Paenibacillus thalictri]|uniref:Uncharacterized protein n=1 Tax=Paenibacillus thalictri TaxID=2527873 RepID=A0A4Q9DMD6_9BACL|nr:hypothetical protein [Paenibacillus thalictri]TBL74583.1 hypothetical protein EYB31_24995 [Paenibacillus thalictri]